LGTSVLAEKLVLFVTAAEKPCTNLFIPFFLYNISFGKFTLF